MKYVTTSMLILFLACQPSKRSEVDLKALKNEILDIHDAVMPQMGELRRTRKSLMLWADSIQNADSLKAVALLLASDKLATANESMMDWMRNFDLDFKGTDEEVLKYLNEQKESIIRVEADMLTCLGSGQKLLEEHQ